jgi:PTS system N-acetylglucosamine-specific IIC component
MDMRAAAGTLAATRDQPSTATNAAAIGDPAPWLAALGGRDNIRECGAASSRVWLRLGDVDRLDETVLKQLGVRMIARAGDHAVQLLMDDADATAAMLQPA